MSGKSRLRSPCASCVFLFTNKKEVRRCAECGLRKDYWTLRHDPWWRTYNDYIEDEPITTYKGEDMAQVDKSAGYFPRFITAGDPHIEPGKTPVDGNLFEVSCALAKLLGEFVESGNRDQVLWVFEAMEQLKAHAIEYYSELHGEDLDG